MKLKRFTFISLFLLAVLCFFGVASAEYSIGIGNMSTDTIQEKVLVETYPNGSANPGDTVQISISAEAGYEMDYLEVYQETDNGLLQINSFSSAEGSSFVMPDGNVRIKVLYTALNPQIVATGTYGGDTVWTLDENGTLTVSGTGSVTSCQYGHDVVKVIIQSGIIGIGDNAFAGIDIFEVEMADTVTSIGNLAFRNCKNLTSIIIPESVVKIGDFVFPSQLTTISIPAGVQEIGRIEYSSKDSNLTEINVSQDNQAYCSVNGVLYNKAMTDLIRYPQKNKSNQTFIIPNTVRTIGPDSCSRTQFTSVVIPDSVTTISDHAFESCNLTELVIPEGVTHIGDNAFAMSQNLVQIHLPDTLISIGEHAFNECQKLNEINLPESLVSIADGAFADCIGLSAITIPTGVINIGSSAFSHCTSLISVILSDSLTSISNGTFYDCSRLTSITIPSGVVRISGDAFTNCVMLTDIVIPEGVTSIGNGAFRNCQCLSNVTIPLSTVNIDINAFYGCHALENISYNGTEEAWNRIIIQEGNDALINAPNITYAFVDAGTCGAAGSNLTWTMNDHGTLTISGIGDMADYTDGDAPWIAQYCETIQYVVIEPGVTGIGKKAFGDCYGISNIDIANTVTSIGESAFTNCESLREITIPDSVTSIGTGAFYFCKNLQYITVSSGNENFWSDGEVLFNKSRTELICYPAGKTDPSYKIPDSVKDIRGGMYIGEPGGWFWAGWGAFSGNTYLTKVTIPDGVNLISVGAFAACENLTSIVIPASVKTIDVGAFSFTGLNDIMIPDGVTTIGDHAFNNCSSLASVTISDSVVYIDQYAFADCANLVDITFQSNSIDWDPDAFFNCTALTSVNVPCNWPSETILLNEETGSIPVSFLDHEWEEATYIWIDEKNKVEAKRVCARDKTHVESEMVSSNRVLVTVPTIDESGSYDWVSNEFINEAFIQQRMSGGMIPALGTLSLLQLPTSLTEIEEEAFAGLPCQAVIVPKGCVTIGDRAFAGCTELLYIFLPDSVTDISADAFEGCDKLVLDLH